MSLTFGSVCSGIGAPELAWLPLGWRSLWSAEIERFPSDVLAHRFPGLPNLGDITAADFVGRAREHGPIDVLVGGTPCQSFSLAGLRGGMDDPRGGLALRFLEIARDLRPRWVCWENVPGVLSSRSHDAPEEVPPGDDLEPGCEREVVEEYEADERADFACFLAGLHELGYGFAYRVLDARFFGIPQRRRRVFVVGCLGDWRGAFAVLFERDSMRGDPPKGGQARARVARALTGSPGRRRGVPDGGDVGGHLIAHTLRGEGFDASEDGTGRGTPLGPGAFDTTQITSAANYSNPRPGDPCHPLTAHGHAPAIAFQERGRPGGKTLEWQEDQAYALLAPSGGARTNELNVCVPVAHTLTSRSQRHDGDSEKRLAVAYQQHGSNVGPMGTLRKGDGGVTSGVPFMPVAFHATQDPICGDISPCLPTSKGSIGVASKWGARRLVPRECEKLQGMPPDWTLVPVRKLKKPSKSRLAKLADLGRLGYIDGEPWELAADGPRYRAIGNSMAVPVLRWIGERLAAVDRIMGGSR